MKNSNRIKPTDQQLKKANVIPSHSTPLSFSKVNPLRQNFKSWIYGTILLCLVSMGWNHFNGGGVGCWPSQKIIAHQIGHFNGNGQSCGPLTIRGVNCLNNGNIAVLCIDNKTVLEFDLKGTLLKSTPLEIFGPFDSNDATIDPESGHVFYADWPNHQIHIQSPKGQKIRNIYLKDSPCAIALDKHGQLFVGFGDRFFIQVFKAETGQFLGDLTIDNPDVDMTYLNAKSISFGKDGLLVVSDRYSVWIYQLAPAKSV